MSAAFTAPVWADNDVNLMALGELRRVGPGRAERHLHQGVAAAGRSLYLAAILDRGDDVDVENARLAAEHGDPTAVALVARSGRLIGETPAMLVNFFDPSLVLIGGGVAGAGDQMLAAVR